MNSSKENLEISHIEKNSRGPRFSEIVEWFEEENKENEGHEFELKI